MTLSDLELTAHFLKRVVARGTEEDLLLDLVDRIEKEIAKCQVKSRSK